MTDIMEDLEIMKTPMGFMSHLEFELAFGEIPGARIGGFGFISGGSWSSSNFSGGGGASGSWCNLYGIALAKDDVPQKQLNQNPQCPPNCPPVQMCLLMDRYTKLSRALP